jgi:hypothetical protein
MRTILAATILIPTLALAQASTPAPRLLPYQGRLLRADGNPETGTPQLTFRIYDAASGGAALWAEQQSVPLTNGFYAVFLGSVAPFTDALFDGSDRWLGVTVEDEAELSPRQQIASVAYAIMATNALQAANAVRADSAARAESAATADSATSAAYATTAGRASTADTATTAATAASATTAANAAHATHADTATNLSGGTVQATTITSSGHVSASGNVSAGGSMSAGGLQVSGDANVGGTLTTTGISVSALDADAALHVPGGVVGGASFGSECIRWTVLPPYECLGYAPTCTAWGDARCMSGNTSADCNAGNHPAEYTRGILRRMGSTALCIQP